ncbi:hypothetical protein BDF14DRAFT_1865699 [Spinellus fusiger]|nr:hypothetical protein BDF14DRAFT_1865699 [Spinellus fusiger]
MRTHIKRLLLCKPWTIVTPPRSCLLSLSVLYRPTCTPGGVSLLSIGPTPLTRRFSHTSTAPQTHKICWKCQTTVPSIKLNCDNTECGAIQILPSDINYYCLLQIGSGPNKDEPTFEVDAKSLRLKFLRLQQKAHPDSYAQAPKNEYEMAQAQSSVINKAYQTLLNPLARAHYLLALKGRHVGESESLQDPQLLMDVLEFREELEEAETKEDVARLKSRNDVKCQETIAHLSEAFHNQELDKAKEYAVQLQYLENNKRSILDWSPTNEQREE